MSEKFNNISYRIMKETSLFRVYVGHHILIRPNPNDMYQAKKVQTLTKKSPTIFFYWISIIWLQRYIHERFTTSFDVGIIIVNRDIPSIFYQNVLLASSPNFVYSINPWNCYSAGWGGINPEYPTYISIQLNEVKLNLLDHYLCLENSSSYNRDYMLCIGAPGKGSCYGDSGGPVMCPVLAQPNKYLIVGINSYGPPLCTSRPSVLTKLSLVIDWVLYYSSNESLTPPRNPTILF